jgi:hypothetical protein
VVEILRPAHRHAGGHDGETIRLIRAGAPMAPFLTQLLARGRDTEFTTAEGTDRYEAAAALMAEPQHVCVATL